MITTVWITHVSCDHQLTSWPVSSTHSLEQCLLASIRTLNMVQMAGATRRSVHLLDLCSLVSKADLVLSRQEAYSHFPVAPLQSLLGGHHDLHPLTS